MINTLYIKTNVIANIACRLSESVKQSHFSIKFLRLLRTNTQGQHLKFVMTD